MTLPPQISFLTKNRLKNNNFGLKLSHMKDLKIMQALSRHTNEIKKHNNNENALKMQKPIINSRDFTKNVFGMSFRSPS